MTIKEFEDKYETDKTITVKASIRKFSGDLVKADVEVYQCEGPLGDMVKDYCEHLQKGFWFTRKTSLEWNIVNNRFKDALNQVVILWNGRMA